MRTHPILSTRSWTRCSAREWHFHSPSYNRAREDRRCGARILAARPGWSTASPSGLSRAHCDSELLVVRMPACRAHRRSADRMDERLGETRRRCLRDCQQCKRIRAGDEGRGCTLSTSRCCWSIVASDVADLFDAQTTPHVFVINDTGRLRVFAAPWMISTSRSASPRRYFLEEAVDALLDGATPSITDDCSPMVAPSFATH